jgi:ElaB/YqjD/DUF883 family membrane-anchored ribosome-binding protein
MLHTKSLAPLIFINVRLPVAKQTLPSNGRYVVITTKTRRFEMDTQTVVAKDKLITDFKAVMADAEELLHATANQAGEKVTVARGRVQERLRSAREELDRAEAMVMNRSKAAARATDGYVHDNPWTVAGVCAGVGLLIGMLISRK